MLVTSEKENLHGKEGVHQGYDEVLKEFSKNPDRMVCALNQNPVKHPTTSHADGSLPTFLASGNQKIWSISRRRWLTATEKFAAMGWPVNKKLSKILNRPEASALSCNGHERIGNGMHVFNLVLVVLAVLGSIERILPDPQKAG